MNNEEMELNADFGEVTLVTLKGKDGKDGISPLRFLHKVEIYQNNFNGVAKYYLNIINDNPNEINNYDLTVQNVDKIVSGYFLEEVNYYYGTIFKGVAESAGIRFTGMFHPIGYDAGGPGYTSSIKFEPHTDGTETYTDTVVEI